MYILPYLSYRCASSGHRSCNSSSAKCRRSGAASIAPTIDRKAHSTIAKTPHEESSCMFPDPRSCRLNSMEDIECLKFWIIHPLPGAAQPGSTARASIGNIQPSEVRFNDAEGARLKSGAGRPIFCFRLT